MVDRLPNSQNQLATRDAGRKSSSHQKWHRDLRLPRCSTKGLRIDMYNCKTKKQIYIYILMRLCFGKLLLFINMYKHEYVICKYTYIYIYKFIHK